MRTSKSYHRISLLLVVCFITLVLVLAASNLKSTSLLNLNLNLRQMNLREKCVSALYSFYVGDALAMPAHWYYDVNQLRSDFGEITKYESPKYPFPGSIMSLSNTGGGGRGSDKGDIVGSVILHGKKQYWMKGGSYHYHHTLKAGENTLDTLVTRVLIKSMIEKKALDLASYRADYITFMTTPGTHNDTYAATSHRMFFKNMISGLPLDQCPDNDGHNVDTIDGIQTMPPIAIMFMNSSEEERDAAIRRTIHVIRRTDAVLPYAKAYVEMLIDVLKGSSIPDAAQAASLKLGFDVAREVSRMGNRGDPMVACYITSAFPALLVFAYKYGDDPQRLLLASVNAGGENVARGSLLGALAGARFGLNSFPTDWREGLKLKEELMSECEAFASIFVTNEAIASIEITPNP